MRKNKFVLVQGALVGLIVLSGACNSNVLESASPATLTQTAVEVTQAAIYSDDIYNEVENYVTIAKANNYADTTVYGAGTPGITLPTVTLDKPDTVSFPKTFTLDYGTTGIVGYRGNTLKGKIIAVITNGVNFRKDSLRNVTFDNFSDNGNAITGSESLIYKGVNSLNYTYWSRSAKDTISRADGTTITWNCQLKEVLYSDNKTPLVYWDDIYYITGSSSGVNAKGKAYTMAIRDNYPLFVGGGYPFFVVGLAKISSENGTVVVDYGDGTADNVATALINGDTKPFTLTE